MENPPDDDEGCQYRLTPRLLELDKSSPRIYIFDMEFEWDQKKNRANYVKHKINFELAREVFYDPLADFVFDRVVDGEERWHAIGKVFGLHVLLVVHTYRNKEDSEIIRILSARRASPHERRHYEER
jgi:uncharacterized DUF497 family protein